MTRAALPLLRKGERPCIVNTASIVGLRPGPQPLPYAASKAAVVNLTKTLAWNLGPEIRVNAVAPGWMEGDWMQRMLKDKYEDLMGKRAKATPLRRVRDRRRRRRDHDEPHRVESVRHRRGDRRRRRLRELDLTMLEGVVPFPPEYAQRYREKGYWQDKSLADEFALVFSSVCATASP